MRIATLTTVFAVAIFAACPVQAQTLSPQPAPENLAAARELVQTIKATDQLKALLPIILQTLKPIVLQGRPEAAKDFEAVLPVINDVALQSADQLVDLLATVYADNFSVGELHDITAFYRTPTGQKLIAKQATIAHASVAASQQWVAGLKGELTQRIEQELNKREHAN